MIKPKYEVKTYFQESKSRQDKLTEYFFQVMYSTVLPSLCLLMAVQLKQHIFFSVVFGLGFLMFTLLQLKVKLV